MKFGLLKDIKNGEYRTIVTPVEVAEHRRLADMRCWFRPARESGPDLKTAPMTKPERKSFLRQRTFSAVRSGYESKGNRTFRIRPFREGQIL